MFLFQVYEVQLDFFHVLIESDLSGDYLNMLDSSRVNPPNIFILRFINYGFWSYKYKTIPCLRQAACSPVKKDFQ